MNKPACTNLRLTTRDPKYVWQVIHQRALSSIPCNVNLHVHAPARFCSIWRCLIFNHLFDQTIIGAGAGELSSSERKWVCLYTMTLTTHTCNRGDITVPNIV